MSFGFVLKDRPLVFHQTSGRPVEEPVEVQPPGERHQEAPEGGFQLPGGVPAQEVLPKDGPGLRRCLLEPVLSHHTQRPQVRPFFDPECFVGTAKAPLKQFLQETVPVGHRVVY